MFPTKCKVFRGFISSEVKEMEKKKSNKRRKIFFP
jgi:hypothetical protein